MFEAVRRVVWDAVEAGAGGGATVVLGVAGAAVDLVAAERRDGTRVVVWVPALEWRALVSAVNALSGWLAATEAALAERLGEGATDG